MWIIDVEYKGIMFQVFCDWDGPEGLKLLLPMNDDTMTTACHHADDLAEGIQYFIERKEELAWVGWANDELFWHTVRQDNTLDYLEQMALMVKNSQFAG